MVARRLAEIKERSGPDSIAFISSSKCTNEEELSDAEAGARSDGHEQYGQLLPLLSITSHGGSFSPRSVMAGTPGQSRILSRRAWSSLSEAIRRKAIRFWPRASEKSHKLRGQKLIVLRFAREQSNGQTRRSFFWHPKPGTDLVWLSKPIARYILDPWGWLRPSFLEEKWVNGLAGIQERVWSLFTMEFAADTPCGLPLRPCRMWRSIIAGEAESVCHMLLGDGCHPT